MRKSESCPEPTKEELKLLAKFIKSTKPSDYVSEEELRKALA